MTGFPQVPLVVLTEILLNGVWTDISEFVYQRDSIVITGGKQNRDDSYTPATMNLTLNNRDGRFTQLNTSGAYYPYLTRNVQIRLTVTATSTTGNFYSGYRFWGEIPDFPLKSDISATDYNVPITAAGPLRRLRSNGGQGSALTRYYQLLTGAFTPIAYWPCEEDPDTDIIGAGIDGGTTMAITTGTPKWKAISDFNGSSAIGVVNRSTWDGLTGSFASSGNDIFSVGGDYQWVAPVSSVNCTAWGAEGGGASANPFAGQGGCAGGGGNRSQETALAVTIGQTYNLHVGFGGQGGDGIPSGGGVASNPGTDGGTSTFPGDSVTVTGNGGKGGTNLAGGAGGVISGNTLSKAGGAGASANTGKAGAGSGSSGGSAAAGNAGSAQSGNTGGAAGAAPTGGFAGGKGGDAPTGSPGPGAGGPFNAGTGYSRAGADGIDGQIQLTYTPPSIPTNNVIRFVVLVPAVHGGNVGKVLLRTLTGGTIARLDVQYSGAGGKLTLIGYNNVNAQLFTSGAQAWNLDGQTAMVSVELKPNGTGVDWAFKAIVPGKTTLIGSASGTQASATIGNVTECIVSPNADITKTGIGHISVQYALIDLRMVSDHLNGHVSEMGVDRFIRLCNEQALDNILEFNETADHWGFESGTQSWVPTNCALTSSTVTANTSLTNFTLFQSWPPEGTHSLLITANGAGAIKASSPIGTSGQPIVPTDTVSANMEVYTPAAISGNLILAINFYNISGTFLSAVSTTFTASAGQQQTVKVTTTGAGAPATSAFISVSLSSSGTPTNGTLIYCDHVRLAPRMGRQERHMVHKLFEEIKDLDEGMIKEAKEAWGFKYRTRIRLINQSPAITLNFAAQQLAGQGPPASAGGQGTYGSSGTPGTAATFGPIFDNQHVKNDITVKRHRGSSYHVTLKNGVMSTQEPPAGTGRKRHRRRVIAETDAQLLALATHLLNLGTVTNERYPNIDIDMTRSEVASIFAACAGIEIGDYVQVTNLPAQYPTSTTKQLVIGYEETITAYGWYISWNCIPESAYEISANTFRRW